MGRRAVVVTKTNKSPVDTQILAVRHNYDFFDFENTSYNEELPLKTGASAKGIAAVKDIDLEKLLSDDFIIVHDGEWYWPEDKLINVDFLTQSLVLCHL